MPAYDIAAIAVCSVILALSAWLQWKAGNHLADARAHLAEARALLEREADPLRVVDGGRP